MNIAIQVLEAAVAILIILCLNMVVRNYKWWLFYSVVNLIFSVVMICKGCPGLTVMGFVLCITAIINYRREKRKEERNENPIS